VGLDLGQAQDFSAFVLVEKTRRPHPDRPDRERNHYGIRTIRRWPLRTPYPDIVEDVCQAVLRPPLGPNPNARPPSTLPDVHTWGTTGRLAPRLDDYPKPSLVVDETGVGRAVCDLFRSARPRAQIVPVTITAGLDTKMALNGGWRVPKVQLESVLKALMQTGRLLIANVPERKLLTKELQAFKARVTATGHEQFEAADWRDRPHDDLVLAVALACWFGEKAQRRCDVSC
jgi:hypothetical protein